MCKASGTGDVGGVVADDNRGWIGKVKSGYVMVRIRVWNNKDSGWGQKKVFGWEHIWLNTPSR